MSNSGQGPDQAFPAHFRLRGLAMGIAAACLGAILFALTFPLLTSYPSKFRITEFLNGLQYLPLIAFIGFLFAILPGGLGGIFLAYLLQGDVSTKRLTLKRAVLKGALAGGIAGVFTSLAGLTIAGGFPSDLGNIANKSIIEYLYQLFNLFIEVVWINISPILLASLIAVFMGALAGRILGGYLIKKFQSIK